MRSLNVRLREIKRNLRALTIWQPYGNAYVNPHWWLQLLRGCFIRTHTSKKPSSQEAISLIFTCDLELDPPWETGSWDTRTLRGIEEGLPSLLNLLDAHGVRGTFFTEGILARLAGDTVLEVARRGHEIGCHGLAHESYGGPYRIDDTIPRPPTVYGRTEKEDTVRKAKEMLEDLVGVPIRAFRAPFLHIDSQSAAAVTNAGFLVDSSLPNQLFGYLSAPAHRDPGRPLTRVRDTHPQHRLIEIPVSVEPRPSLRSHHPYRFIQQATRTQSVLQDLIEVSALASVPITLVLLVHPWEFVEGFPSPFGHDRGTVRTERLARFLDTVSAVAPVRCATIGTFASEWERSRCPWHADTVRSQSFQSSKMAGNY